MSGQAPRFRTLHAPGRSATAVEELTIDVLRSSPLEVRHLAPGRIGVSRSFRPTWTLVLAVLLFPIGLLFLLVKNTEAGEVIVVDGPTGPVVTVPPVVSAELLQTLDSALTNEEIEDPIADRRPAPTQSAPSRPPVVESSPAANTSPPRPTGIIGTIPGVTPTADFDQPIAAPQPVAQTRPAAAQESVAPLNVRLRFPAGEIVIAPGERITLGRRPAVAAGGLCHAVPGDASTVSKTHAEVYFDGSTVIVTDLHSTNGTSIAVGDASEPVLSGASAEAPVGARIVFGAASCDVVLEGASQTLDGAVR